jgi:hypothetical protein
VAAPVQIVDTVGAGDAFSAVFLFGQMQGWPLALTLARANAFAGAICGISGAVPADISFYTPWMAAGEPRHEGAPVVLADRQHEHRFLRHPVQFRPAAEQHEPHLQIPRRR